MSGDWREIPGHPGYWASTGGHVKSPRRESIGTLSKRSGRIVVWLGSSSRMMRASAVCLAFYGPRPDGMTVSHLDGNRLNDRPDNLTYESLADNVRRKVGHGTVRRGVDINTARFTEDQVREIRALREKGLTLWSIARMFGSSAANVQNITTRRTWKHVV